MIANILISLMFLVPQSSDATSVRTFVIPQDATPVKAATAMNTAGGNGAYGAVSADATGSASNVQSPAPPSVPGKAGDATVIQKVEVKGVDSGVSKPPYIRVTPRGPNGVWGGMGLQAGLTDNSTGGFRVAAGYLYRMTRSIWMDSEFSTNFGGDCDRNVDSAGETYYTCGGMSGVGISMMAGLIWRSLDRPSWSLDLTPYLRGLVGLAFIFSDGPNDGLAIIAKGAAGARYSFTDEFAVGAEFGITLGPAFRNHMGAGGFTTLDFTVVTEYSF